MDKTIIITEQQSLKLLSENDGVEYVELTPEEYIRYLTMVSYDGRLLYKIPKFRGKKIIINKQLDLSGLPVKDLGPIVINGGLDISNTKISSLDNVDIRSRGRIVDWGSPLRKIRERKEFLAKAAQQELRRERGEWDDESELDYIGLCANALFKHLIYTEYEERTPEDSQRLQELYAEKERREEIETETEDNENLMDLEAVIEEIDEIEKRIDVYDLHYEGNHYYLKSFKLLTNNGESKETWAVGDEYATKRSAFQAAEDLIDDIGVDGFNKSFVEDYIDEEELKDYFRDGEYDNVRENLEDYFDEDDFEYTDPKVQERIDEIEMRLEDSEIDQEEYDELNEELDELKDSNKDIPEHLIDDKVESLLDDLVSGNALEVIQNYGLTLKYFVNMRDLIEGMIQSDGYGHTLNNYNGGEETVEFNNETYYIFQIDG